MSELMWWGQPLAIDLELDYLMPMHHPIMLNASAEVRDVTMSPLTLNTTIGDVKRWIHHTKGIPAQDCQLTFAGRLLPDDSTLGERNIKHGNTLHLFLGVKGGTTPKIQFVDVSNSNSIELRRWDPTAPVWRRAGQGLCVEGVCKNRVCSAYGQLLVISNQHFGTFDLVIDARRCKCPCCDARITPTTCAFNNCQWRYSGIKDDGRAGMRAVRSEDWRVAGDQYERFRDAANNQVVWARLLLVTQPTGGSKGQLHFSGRICLGYSE